MNVEKMLAELRAEREAVEEAIIAIERVASARKARRGRPPKWLLASISEGAEPTKKRGRPKKQPEMQPTGGTA